MTEKDVVERLEEIVGKKNVQADKIGLTSYGYDATLLSGVGMATVFPLSTEHVVKLVKLANEAGFTLIPRGAGTNLSGGTIPDGRCVTVNFSRMKKILDIDTENFVAVVEPGLVNFDLQAELEKKGFYYPPDPASYKATTLGGNLAECSGGPRCFKYGVTRDYILGLEVVLPDGKVIQTGGRNFNSEPGYDLTRILVGSEGTLALLTKIFLRILPLPAAKKTMLAIYNQVEDASQTVSDIVAAGIVPTTLEMMDNLLINTAEDATGAGLPRDAGALLIIEIDGHPEDMDEQVETIAGICKKARVREFKMARTAAEVDQLWLARRVVIGSVARRRPSYSLQDITVPRSMFPNMVSGILQIAKERNLEVGILAHAGDGNMHPLVLFDQRIEEEVERVHLAEKDICALALELGGTLSGEHGIGLLKKKYLTLEFSPVAMACFAKIKNSFDPRHLLNPGKIMNL
ncbi:CO dehydrogenase flavoprotein-like, FAD-binding, subdomain 2 [Acididesulfobacillus acetoxydans]|uniref:CO dehydrogenase flavoprotein-like, FAD-binding, subdomain 2 n=1 Tax=Acididesulfobacillus acetoxydans TaxID=1561005 RepID=A0A8S0WDR4_9FIRM|nr:FAD-linked oxidase C-terminal domain-containing protein [Acididesulfobacillus acetoxydans]CAA7599482.1 CO dehydrogenase flavoprotein-like, FAD-binding, subdomain 2 [Acididesulfobacillus acetoxydans]CEJ09289.1 Glycolate oxidase subunit GlcD [Acididesulfobacillus acetoxydans]